MGDDALDKKYGQARGYERPRLFYQVRTVGSSPNELRGKSSRKTIYEGAHQNGQHAYAKGWFESPLWVLLTDPTLDKSFFTTLIRQEVDTRGWFRPTSDEIGVGKRIFDSGQPAFKSGVGDPYRNMLLHMSALPGLDGLVLLSALFREAYFEFQLELAQDALHVLEATLQRIVGEMPRAMPQHLKECVHLLIEDRVLYNVWISEGDMPLAEKLPTATRVMQIRRFLSWYRSVNNPQRSYSVSTHLIVPVNERLQWFRRNQTELHQLWDSARELIDAEIEEEIDKLGIRNQAELKRRQSEISRIAERGEFSTERELTFREKLLLLEPMPRSTEGSYLTAPIEIPLDSIFPSH